MIAIRLLRDRAVMREAVFTRLPITIGRGAENDFVIADPSVSRCHARLDKRADGSVLLHDLGSRNGIRVGGKLTTEIIIVERIRLRLGLVELELEPLPQVETQELRREDWERLSRRRSVIRIIGALLLGTAGWLSFEVLEADFWSPWQQHRTLALLSHGVGALLALPILAFILLIVLRTIGRPVRMFDTLAYLSRIIWLIPASSVVSFVGYYLLSSTVYSVLQFILGAVVMVVTVVEAASLRRPRPSLRFRAAWSLALMALIVAISTITRMEGRRNGLPQLEYGMQMPLAAHVGRTQPLDAYLVRLKRTSAIAELEASKIHARQEQLER